MTVLKISCSKTAPTQAEIDQASRMVAALPGICEAVSKYYGGTIAPPPKIGLVPVERPTQKVKVWLNTWKAYRSVRWQDLGTVFKFPAPSPHQDGFRSGIWSWKNHMAYVYYPRGAWIELCAEEIAHSVKRKGIRELPDGDTQHAEIKRRLMESAKGGS